MTALSAASWTARINAWCLRRWSKPLLFVLLLGPLAFLLAAAALNQLGANPAQALLRSSGDWTLRALCLVLALTPLRVTLKLSALARWRRMLGLFVFFYASLHLLAYAWLDMGFAWLDIVYDIPKRPFILVGFVAYIGLLALALSSPNAALRWLGGKNWRRLHRLVYLVAVLAVLHFFWIRAGKNDFAEVWLYAATLGWLLGWRLWHAWRSRRK